MRVCHQEAVIEPFGIYIHFPYCLSKCPYCDFASRAAPVIPQVRYTDAVLRELELRTSEFPSRTTTSIFFGGGTPSMWEPVQVARVLQALRERYPWAPDIEITLEANPGASDEARFAAYREAGVNRLSIGAQSFQPEVLVGLGRKHTPDEVGRAVRAGRAAGFSNISIDLIYGAPAHTVERVRDDAKRALALETDHLSAYALTLVHLAEEVPMARDQALGRIVVPDDDSQADMGEAVREELARGGFYRYEISNYCRPGREARHNLLYWRGGGYLALGVGASGFVKSANDVGGIRYMNKRAPEFYFTDVDANALPEKDREQVDAKGIFLERLFTGLRLVEGLDLAALDQLCGTNATSRHDLLLRKYARDGFLGWDGHRVALTTRGLELHTAIATDLAS
jgi:putative oxygen-independent coproporphyrinogen III oxidase